MEHDGGEHGTGNEAQWPRHEQQHQEDDGGGSEMRPLTAAAGHVDHGCLGGTAVDDERTADAGRRISEAEAN